jgi:hypothetical protein
MFLPAVCDGCGAMFEQTAYEFSGRQMSLEGIRVGPCPRCGGEGHLPDRLLVEAGFSTVEILPSARTMRLPSLESLVLGHLFGHPVASAVAALGEEQRAGLAKQVKTALQRYADGDGVAVPDEINIAMAQA